MIINEYIYGRPLHSCQQGHTLPSFYILACSQFLYGKSSVVCSTFLAVKNKNGHSQTPSYVGSVIAVMTTMMVISTGLYEIVHSDIVEDLLSPVLTTVCIIGTKVCCVLASLSARVIFITQNGLTKIWDKWCLCVWNKLKYQSLNFQWSPWSKFISRISFSRLVTTDVPKSIMDILKDVR